MGLPMRDETSRGAEPGHKDGDDDDVRLCIRRGSMANEPCFACYRYTEPLHPDFVFVIEGTDNHVCADCAFEIDHDLADIFALGCCTAAKRSRFRVVEFPAPETRQ